MLEARIYVGLRDKDSHEQIFETEKYKAELKEICKAYHAPFSLQVIEGGYFYDDGTWVEEHSLLITLIGVSRKTAYAIARNVCSSFHQESVMITCATVLPFNVHDSVSSND